MLRDRHMRLLLVLIAALLAANLVVNLRIPIVRAEQAKSDSMAQILHFRSSSAGVALACSSDGKIVFAADDEDVYRSLSFGVPGSWEHVSSAGSPLRGPDCASSASISWTMMGSVAPFAEFQE